MNFYALFGLVGAVVAVTFGVIGLAPLMVYYDFISVMFVLFITLFMMIATFGLDDVKRVGLGSVRCWLNPADATGWSPAQHMKAVRFADVGGYLCMVAGTVGTLIGCVQMLQQLDDVSTIGPALAVALLTVVYPVALYAFLFLPLSRFHQAQAGVGTVVAADVSLNRSLVILALTMLAMGGSFSILLVAMLG